MKGKNCFTTREADQIRVLLDKKCKTPSEEQKSYRDDLRSIGFYISDFTDSKAGFTSADFDALIENNLVSLENYNVEVLKRIYPLLKSFVYHYKAYKGLYKFIKELPGKREFWVYTIDAHLQMATLIWSMVFGNDKNETHWKKLELDNNSFKDYFVSNYETSEDEWKENWKYIIEFRNKYVAHKEVSEYLKAVPYFDIAYNAVLGLELWIREKTQDIFPFATLDNQVYDEDIENTIRICINENISL